MDGAVGTERETGAGDETESHRSVGTETGSQIEDIVVGVAAPEETSGKDVEGPRPGCQAGEIGQ